MDVAVIRLLRVASTRSVTVNVSVAFTGVAPSVMPERSRSSWPRYHRTSLRRSTTIHT